jgi:hypothetical protein
MYGSEQYLPEECIKEEFYYLEDFNDRMYV